MSFQSREKKRRYKAALTKVKTRRTGETAGRWFLTLAKRPGRYMCCGDRFSRGDEIVFRFKPRGIRCVRCADGYRTSLRWDKARAKQRPKDSTPILEANPHLQEKCS